MASSCYPVRNNWYQSGPVLGGRDVAGKLPKVSENGKVQNEPVEARLNRIEMGVKETYRKLEAGLLVGDETWRKNLIKKLEWMKKEIEEIRKEEAEGDEDAESCDGVVEALRVSKVGEGEQPMDTEKTTVGVVDMQNPPIKRKEEEEEKEKKEIKARKEKEYLPDEIPRNFFEDDGGRGVYHLLVVSWGSTSKRLEKFKEASAGACGSGGGPGGFHRDLEGGEVAGGVNNGGSKRGVVMCRALVVDWSQERRQGCEKGNDWERGHGGRKTVVIGNYGGSSEIMTWKLLEGAPYEKGKELFTYGLKDDGPKRGEARESDGGSLGGIALKTLEGGGVREARGHLGAERQKWKKGSEKGIGPSTGSGGRGRKRKRKRKRRMERVR